ncbi:MAG: ABC transporter permease [Planctomycetaceae bacterium]
MATIVGRDVIARARRWQQPVVIGAVGAVFCMLVLLPLASPLLGAAGEALRLQALRAFRVPGTWTLLVRSLGLSAAVALVAAFVGTFLGLLLGRTDVAGRRVLLLLHAFPMFLPPFLLALGWFYLFGRQGFAGNETTARLLFHESGHVAILGLAFAPIVSALTALGLWNVDPSLEEAGWVVARPLRVATGILLPAVWPATLLGASLVFALAFSELGVPMFLRVRVYPAVVFSRLGGIDYDPAEAVLLALPLVPVAVLLLVAERRLLGRRTFDVLGLRHRGREPLPLGRGRWPATLACWTLALMGSLPILALVLRAREGGGFAELSGWIGGSLFNSLVGAGIAATAIVAVGAVLGHACARSLPGARLLDAVGVLAFLAPAVLLGVGLIALWNRPETRLVYGGIGIVVLGYVARYGVIGMRSLAVAMAQSPASLEQAAEAFGAGYLRRLFAIVLPMHGRALVAAWLLGAVFCLRDLETAVLYYPPGREPLTVRIFTLEANGPEPVVAALAAVHVLVTAVVLAAGGLMLGARGSR